MKLLHVNVFPCVEQEEADFIDHVFNQRFNVILLHLESTSGVIEDCGISFIERDFSGWVRCS